MDHLIIGISGASGIIYGIRLLKRLKEIGGFYTHLVMSNQAIENIGIETKNYSKSMVCELADAYYENSNLAAPISSGSFVTTGMVIVPCSMKTLAGIANGFSDCLLVRAADVVLKENRKLVLCPRETPLSTIHLKNMLNLKEAGVIILPPMPAFYNQPLTIMDIVDYHTVKILDQFNIHVDNDRRWH